MNRSTLGTRFRRALAALGAATMSLGLASGTHHWEVTHNNRFGTEAEIPVDLFVRHTQSDNEDGTTWEANDGARLLVFGQWNVEELDARRHAARMNPNDQRYAGLTYKIVRKGYLAASGSEGDTIYYERYRYDDPSGALHALVLEYPRSRRAIYDPLVKRISRSLRWSEPQR